MMCTLAHPSSYSSVTPVIVDGTSATGRGWPASLDEKGFRFDCTDGGYGCTFHKGKPARQMTPIMKSGSSLLLNEERRGENPGG